MLKKILKILIGLALVSIVLLFVALLAWLNMNLAVGEPGVTKSFVISKGSSGGQVAAKLEKDGLIKSAFFFKAYLRLTNKGGKILPGSYSVQTGLTTAQIAEILLSGPKDIWVLVPEGLRVEEVADRVAQGLGLRGLEKNDFIEAFLEEAIDKEGFLFPDTYLFPKDIKAEAVVRKMQQVFDSQTTFLDEELAANATSGLSKKEVVTLASIVEREARKDSDRPIVAGILLNRLDIGMGLQADATVQYAVANEACKIAVLSCKDWWPVVSGGDLKIDSPFNTYKYQGLPPSPISNPGITALRAVVYPSLSDSLYYLHDKSGNMHTAKTFEEHTKNISQFLR